MLQCEYATSPRKGRQECAFDTEAIVDPFQLRLYVASSRWHMDFLRSTPFARELVRQDNQALVTQHDLQWKQETDGGDLRLELFLRSRSWP